MATFACFCLFDRCTWENGLTILQFETAWTEWLSFHATKVTFFCAQVRKSIAPCSNLSSLFCRIISEALMLFVAKNFSSQTVIKSPWRICSTFALAKHQGDREQQSPEEPKSFHMLALTLHFLHLDMGQSNCISKRLSKDPHLTSRSNRFTLHSLFTIVLNIIRHHWFISREIWRIWSIFNTRLCGHVKKWSNFGHFVLFIWIHFVTKMKYRQYLFKKFARHGVWHSSIVDVWWIFLVKLSSRQ